MRTITQVMADPLASAEEIFEVLPSVYMLHHPNCPPDLWWRKAEMYPRQAMLSPLYLLWALETPEAWENLERACVVNWINREVESLPFGERHSFVAECLQSVWDHMGQASSFLPGDWVKEAIQSRYEIREPLSLVEWQRIPIVELIIRCKGRHQELSMWEYSWSHALTCFPIAGCLSYATDVGVEHDMKEYYKSGHLSPGAKAKEREFAFQLRKWQWEKLLTMLPEVDP